MDNSDDYFDDDDFVLDDATEAALAATERQYATQVSATQEPAAKKQKTTTGWAPRPGMRTDSFGDMEYPEITVQGNGYTASSRTQALPAPIQTRSAGYNPQPAPQNRAANPPRPPQRNVAGTSSHRPPVSNYNHGSATRFTTAVNHGRAPPAPAQVAAVPQLQTQVEQLQQQLEALRKLNEQTKADLQAALNAKVVKEGEVTILRKTIEKTAQNHASEIATLKSAKQEADARQMQMQKGLKEEVERLKTQLQFKQQEIDFSLRKGTNSVRSKKVREPPATPGGWHGLSQRPNLQSESQETPSRPLFERPPKLVSPKKSPAKPKRTVTLPGFQNSFTTSTPLKPSQSRTKGKERNTAHEDGNVFNTVPSQFAGRSWSRPSPSKEPKSAPPIRSSPTARFSPLPQPADSGYYSQAPLQDVDGDVVMVEEPQNEVVDQYDLIEPPNWTAELPRILFTHVRPGCTQLTFQQLLAVTFSGENADADSKQYTLAYISVMNSISHPATMEGYEQCIKSVAQSFVNMIDILSNHPTTWPTLASLLNLAATLSFFLPGFRTGLLRSQEAHSPSCALIRTLTRLVQSSLLPSLASEGDVGRELLGLLEVITFELPDEESLKLSVFVRNREVMMTLLNPEQPLPILEQVLRVLVLLSTRKSLCWSLLSLPDPDRADQHDPSARNGITERLCSLLVEPNRDKPMFYPLKESIMLYFAQLSVAHPNAYATLGSLALVLASIIWHTAHLTAPIFEDDEDLMESPEDSKSLVQQVYQCVYFVHFLTIKDKAPGTLAHKLQQAPPRPFHVVHSLHSVAFGRLAAATPPDWLEESSRKQLEEIKDMSLTILQEVVDGLELDGCFNAYTFGRSQEQRLLDEGEMEDQMTRDEPLP